MKITRRHITRTRTYVEAEATYAVTKIDHHDTKPERWEDEIFIPVRGTNEGNVYTISMSRSEAALLIQDLLDLVKA